MDLSAFSAGELAIMVGALALAGFVKGAIGLGLPIVSVPVLAAFVGLPHAVALVAAPLILTNMQQVWQFRAERHHARVMRPLLVSCAIGIAIGTSLLVQVDERYLSAVLGLLILVYGGLYVLRPDTHLGARAAQGLAVPVGLTGGALQGMTGISAPVSLVYLHALRWPRPKFMFAVSATYLTFGVAQSVSLTLVGLMTPQIFLLSCLTMVPIGVCMAVGQRLGRHFSKALFERLVLGLMVLLGLRMLWVAFA